MDDAPAGADRSANADPEPDAEAAATPASGLVKLRTALVGLGLIWLTAVSVFGTVLAVVHGFTVSVEYLLVSMGTAVIAIAAALAALRTFGYR